MWWFYLIPREYRKHIRRSVMLEKVIQQSGGEVTTVDHWLSHSLTKPPPVLFRQFKAHNAKIELTYLRLPLFIKPHA